MRRIQHQIVLGLLMIIFTVCNNASLCAQTTWTDWIDAIFDVNGTANGTLNGVEVSYSGQVLSNSDLDGSSNVWNLESSFVGGAVSQSPDEQGDVITLDGGNTGLQTITFSETIENPIIAIWSLGRLDEVATFDFSETPTFQAGGPNSSFGGNPLEVSGSTVSGFEGNGVVLFEGSFDSISFSSSPEFFYGFTVGTVGAIAVPEPSSGAILILSFLTLSLHRSRE